MNLLRFEPTGAPKGFLPIKGKVSQEVAITAKQVLKQLFNKGFGAAKIINIDGINYCFKLEKHWHPLDYQYGPRGDHQGITVYVEDKKNIPSPQSTPDNSEKENPTNSNDSQSKGNGRINLLKKLDKLLNLF